MLEMKKQNQDNLIDLHQGYSQAGISPKYCNINMVYRAQVMKCERPMSKI